MFEYKYFTITDVVKSGTGVYEYPLQEEVFDEFPVGTRLKCTQPDQNMTGRGVVIMADEQRHSIAIKVFWDRIPKD
jgi:hypothetical protein